MKAAGYPAIYELPAEEAAKWQAKVQPVWDKWLKDATAKGAPAQAILDDCVKFAAQYSYENLNPDMSATIAEWNALPSP